MQLTSITEYQNCRIHTSRLNSGMWVVSIVAPGAIVQHLRGEFESPTHAILAAKRWVDQGAPADATPGPSV